MTAPERVITVCRADPIVRERPVEGICLDITESIPPTDYADSFVLAEAAEFFQGQAEKVNRALSRLPDGTRSHLFAIMASERANVFRVSASRVGPDDGGIVDASLPDDGLDLQAFDDLAAERDALRTARAALAVEVDIVRRDLRTAEDNAAASADRAQAAEAEASGQRLDTRQAEREAERLKRELDHSEQRRKSDSQRIVDALNVMQQAAQDGYNSSEHAYRGRAMAILMGRPTPAPLNLRVKKAIRILDQDAGVVIEHDEARILALAELRGDL